MPPLVSRGQDDDDGSDSDIEVRVPPRRSIGIGDCGVLRPVRKFVTLRLPPLDTCSDMPPLRPPPADDDESDSDDDSVAPAPRVDVQCDTGRVVRPVWDLNSTGTGILNPPTSPDNVTALDDFA